jgi:hypothetical protein
MNINPNSNSVKVVDSKKSRNERSEKGTKIEEYNKLIEQYLDSKSKVDLHDINYQNGLLNKSVNFNYLKTEYKNADLNMSNLNNTGIFRTQNRSNASFTTNTNQNERSFVLNTEVSPNSRGLKNSKLTDLLNSRFVIQGLEIENKGREKSKERFPVIEGLKDNNKQKSNHHSPIRSNEFTFDKTFGKNSEIPQKLIVSKEAQNYQQLINFTKERKVSPFRKDYVEKHSKHNKMQEFNSTSNAKEKGIKLDQPIQFVYNNNLSQKSTKQGKLEEFNEDKQKINKSFNKQQTELSQTNEKRKPQNESCEIKPSTKMNVVTSLKDKSAHQQKESIHSRDASITNLNTNNQHSPIRKSDVSNLSAKNSVFTSVNSGNYAQTKISTNESKSVLGMKMNDPESIEEMHYLYVKFHQKTKQMMHNQESRHPDQNKVFMYKTVVPVEEVDIG